ncbi:hypothetical protein N7488_005174 [Penicillium malachiteum]|nr:hypothetical protein N7488_005174 [Penicillium malachiteum]
MEQPEENNIHTKTLHVAQENNEDIFNELPSHHIRLLELLPGSECDLVEVKLHIVPMADPGVYKALSYLWGSMTDDLRLIVCNGYEFTVTANLFKALRRFRDSSEARVMWIDAICIHQGSISERAQQVRIMGQIYECAEEVLVWLGEDSPEVNIKRAFDVVSTRVDYRLQCISLDKPEGPAIAILYITDPDLFDLIEQVKRRFDRQRLPKDYLPRLPEWIEDVLRQSWVRYPESPLLMHIGCRQTSTAQNELSEDGASILGILPDWDISHVRRVASEEFATFTDFLIEATKPAEMRLSDSESAEVLTAINYLLEKPYFRRAWIIQEIILARKATLVCGDHEVDFEGFWRVFSYVPLEPISINNFMLDDFKIFNLHENTQKVQAWSRFMKPSDFPRNERLSFFNSLAYIGTRGDQGKLGLFDVGALLHHFGQQRSTDERDQIFSLVGLLQKFSKRSGVLEWAESCVDYSLDVRDVYLRTAKHIVENHYEVDKANKKIEAGSYHILDFFGEMIGPSTEQLDLLPTWVPNWSVARERTIFNTRHVIETDRLIPFDARVQGESLMISGCIVDEVNFCSEALDYNEQMFQELNLCHMLVEQENKKKTPSIYGGFKAQFEGFWRTIIADNPIGAKPITDHTYHFHEQDEVKKWVAECRRCYRQACQAWSNELKYRPILGPALAYMQGYDRSDFSNDDDKIQTIIQRLDKVRLLELLELDEPRWGFLGGRLEMSKHILIKTKQGYFGLGPPSVQCGDTLALLAGCSHPWYIRQQDHHYTIVGNAWVHGLMYKSDPFYQHEDFRMNCSQIELR